MRFQWKRRFQTKFGQKTNHSLATGQKTNHSLATGNGSKSKQGYKGMLGYGSNKITQEIPFQVCNTIFITIPSLKMSYKPQQMGD